MDQSPTPPRVRFVTLIQCADPARVAAVARRLDLEVGVEAALELDGVRLVSLAAPRDPLRMAFLREHFDRIERLYEHDGAPVRIQLACVDPFKVMLAEDRETPWSIYIGKGAWARIALTRSEPSASFAPFQLGAGVWESSEALAFISAAERLNQGEA